MSSGVLFDFLMPGFLRTIRSIRGKIYPRLRQRADKKFRISAQKGFSFYFAPNESRCFRRFTPVSEIVYHCQLSEAQLDLYRSYAQSARDELVKLVEREGFDQVQIHVLATLTRLKQICCHPAIFAKEKAEPGDSAKYDMLLDLLQPLIEGKHKTVIFSQYTRMLQIMREDFEAKGIASAYLDGSSKNRLEIVKRFNEDQKSLFSSFLSRQAARG